MAPKIFVFAILSLLLPACMAQTNLWCCPAKGPGNLFLQLQQTNTVKIFCDYGVGPVYPECTYDKNGNLLVPKDGCPPKADPNPSGVTCPLTNVIHPNFDPKNCVTVPRYADMVNVVVQPCTGANNQKFVFKQGSSTSIRAAGTNFCLDAVPTVGSKVKIRPCVKGAPRQTWIFTLSNFILKSFVLGIQRVQNTLELRVHRNNVPAQIWTSP